MPAFFAAYYNTDLCTVKLYDVTPGAIATASVTPRVTLVTFYPRSKLRGEPELQQPVLDVYYELNPVTSALDLLLRVTTQPVDIVYNEDILDRLAGLRAFFRNSGNFSHGSSKKFRISH